MSFLEMLDVVNEGLIRKGRTRSRSTPTAARASAACAAWSSTASRTGRTAAPPSASSTCGASRTATRSPIEPWRAKAFPVVKDLVVDRSAFDRIIAAGGYVSVNCGGAPDGNAIPIAKDVVEAAMDSAACIGCGACVAACKNASAHLFMSAKISHLALLPQGQVERYRRVVAMIDQADAEGFGSCSNEGECEAVCPKEIPISNIARMTREYVTAMLVAKVAGKPAVRLRLTAAPLLPRPAG